MGIGKQPPFFIAEAGVNHNGSLDMALRLVAEAKRCGAHCVKFQTFRASDVADGKAPKAAYQMRTTDSGESQLDMLRKLELPEEAWQVIMRACEDEGTMFLSTPYGAHDVALLDRLGAQAFKIASGQIVEPTFLARVARTGKPILLSTGMATLAEVDEALRVIRAGRQGVPRIGTEALADVTLLQCTTDYPSRLQDANLSVIPLMATAFGLPVGYSDHTEGDVACVVAAALGARIFEKHFTLDRTLPGPDQSSSADPAQYAAHVRAVEQALAALGHGTKEPCEREAANLPNMRRGCVAARDLAAGEMLTEDDVAFRRPLRGVPAARVDMLLGRTLRAPVAAGEFFGLDIVVEGGGGR